MTLKEIKKIIDESTLVYVDTGKAFLQAFVEMTENVRPILIEMKIEDLLESGNVLYFYKFNKETGEMTLLGKIDHVDEEKKKKIIKKKLDEMTQEELWQVKDRVCNGGEICGGCPFFDNSTVACLVDFKFWKKQVEDNKDKEFEIEVEE